MSLHLATSWAPERDLNDELQEMLESLEDMKGSTEKDNCTALVGGDWNSDVNHVRDIMKGDAAEPPRSRSGPRSTESLLRRTTTSASRGRPRCRNQRSDQMASWRASREWKSEGLKRARHMRSVYEPVHMSLEAESLCLIQITVKHRSTMWGFLPSPASARRLAMRWTMWEPRSCGDIQKEL